MVNTFLLTLSWFILVLAIIYFITARRWINKKIIQIEEKKEELLEILDSSNDMINELNNLSDYIANKIDEKNIQLSTIYKEVEDKLKQYDYVISSIKIQNKDMPVSNKIENEKIEQKEHSDQDNEGLDKSSIYYKILDLSNQGFNINDIARQLNIGKGEIQLILGMNK